MFNATTNDIQRVTEADTLGRVFHGMAIPLLNVGVNDTCMCLKRVRPLFDGGGENCYHIVAFRLGNSTLEWKAR